MKTVMVNIMDTHSFHFSEVLPGTKDYETYLQLRYSVFCEELKRIKGTSLPRNKTASNQETDAYDPYSRHFLGIHMKSGTPAACVRLILPNPRGLNIHARYIVNKIPYPEADYAHTAELSRMAIAPFFRRRRDDQGKPFEGDPRDELPNMNSIEQSNDRRHHQPELVLGMYREIYHLANQLNITHCFAAMEPSFSRLLIKLGFPFTPVGPINMHVQPPRRPYIISSHILEQQLAQYNPYLLDFLRGQAA